MSLIADILLVAASVGLAIYCLVLSRRLSRFTDLEKGVGGAVAVLSAQVDDLTRALKSAQTTAQNSANALSSTTERAEDAARRLELHVAALHDLPPVPTAAARAASAPPEPPRDARTETADNAEADGAAEVDTGTTAEVMQMPAFSHSSRRTALNDERHNVEPAVPGESIDAPDNPVAGQATSLFSTQRRIQPGALG